MDRRPTWTDCDEAGDYVVPNVLSPRDLVFRPDNMDETVPHTYSYCSSLYVTTDKINCRIVQLLFIENTYLNAEKALLYGNPGP